MFIVLPSLILQKPFKNSKAKNHCLKLEERMKLLLEGSILEDIIKDCKLFQCRLVTSKRQKANSISKKLAKLMLSGKVIAFLKLLTSKCNNGKHEVNEEIISEPSRTIVQGKNEIMSREGTTQGDNLELSFRVFGITPLLRSLKIKCASIKQIYLSDNVVCAEKVKWMS